MNDWRKISVSGAEPNSVEKLKAEVTRLSGKVRELYERNVAYAERIRDHRIAVIEHQKAAAKWNAERGRLEQKIVSAFGAQQSAAPQGAESRPWSVPEPPASTGTCRVDLLELLKHLTKNVNFVVLTNAYPSAQGGYGGEFVRTRVDAYVAAGLMGCVIEVNKRNNEVSLENRKGLCIARFPQLKPEDIACALASGAAAILSHSPPPALQDALNQHVKSRRLAYWFHGFELRDYRRLFYNYDTAEMETRRASLDLINQQRQVSARVSFENDNVIIVLVSDYLHRIAVRDVGLKPKNRRIIHNFIDTSFYSDCLKERRSEELPRILMIRPFTNRNYCTDIVTEAIKSLSNRPGFERLRFSIRGFGKHFETDTSGIKEFENVAVENRYSSLAEMKQLFIDHDIALCPTRHDTQGVTFGEAMASGLACITHDVAAIPEFADANCAVLVKPDNVKAYADAIWDLAHDRARIRKLGRAAAKRVHDQCGWSQTIGMEITLIRELNGAAE